MANYKEIKGFGIQTTDTDPVVYAGSWASGGNMNTARQFAGSAGTYDAGLVAGGETSTEVQVVEEYDGSSWTEVGDLNETKYALRGFGTSAEACYMVGGRDPGTANMEAFNGSSWTETTNLPTATFNGAAVGTSTAGLYIAGYVTANVAESYEWDGSSWTDGGDVNTARARHGAVGVTTSALAFAGDGSPQAITESYDGTSWTEVGDMNTGRRQVGSSSFSRTSSSALVFGGEAHPPGTNDAETESWDGTAWTEVADLSTARAAMGHLGTASSAVCAGGEGLSAATEEWSFPSTPAVQLGQVWFNTGSTALKGYAAAGTGAWASGTNLPAARDNSNGFGTTTAAQVAGGKDGPGSNIATNLNWNGSSWTEVGDLNTARRAGVGFGASSTSGMIATGYTSSQQKIAETWDGSSWTEITDLNTEREYAGGAGTVTAGLVAAGSDPGNSRVNSEEWNGSAWTEGNNCNSGKIGPGSSFQGTQSSALLFGGKIPPSSTGIKDETEEYDGTSWTEVGDLNQKRVELCGAGVAGSALAYGGAYPSTTKVGVTESYNGSSWTEVADLSTARMNINLSNGTSLNCLAVGGMASTANVEEWEVPGATKTLTVS